MKKLTVGRVERTYYLHVPEQRPAAAPLVIVLHGGTSDGKMDIGRYGWEHMANGQGFVVAGPDGVPLRAHEPVSVENYRAWNQGGIQLESNISKSDDIGFIAALVDEVARATPIDRRRVYVAGFSSGGGLAHRLGLEMSDRIAAISASAAGLPPSYKKPPRGMPILLSFGDRDPVAPVAGRGTFVTDSHRVLVDKWRTLNDCPAARREPSVPQLQIEVSGPCRDGSEVRYYLMLGIDHAWLTNEPVALTRTSWNFLTRFSLPR